MKPYRLTIYMPLALAALVVFAGCGLDGVSITLKAVGTDNTPAFSGGGTGGTGGGGTGGGGTGGSTTDTRFAGTWIASYGDDLPEGAGRQQYAARMVLQQQNGAVSGTGTMLRYFNTGSAASDVSPFAIAVTGTASGDDTTLTFTAGSGRFKKNPQLFLRLVGTRLVGVYVERSSDLIADRYGHVTWYKVAGISIGGSWASGFHDDLVPGSPRDPRDRTALLTLAVDSNNALSGTAQYVEQVPGTTPETVDFSVQQGVLQSTQVTLAIEGNNPDDGLVDWFGFHTTGLFVGAYGLFDGSDLSRFGHATFYVAPDAQPSGFQHQWVSSFHDSDAAGSLKPADYLLLTSDFTVNGNAVSGAALILDESDQTPAFATYTIENGAITGTELTMDLVRSGSRFSWNLRLAGSVLAGSYQQFNGSNQFVSRGVAEWRSGSSASSGLPGSWAAAYFDTYTSNAQENRSSQLAVMSISNISGDGVISGTGTVQLANEAGRRQFAVGGATAANPVQITWSGGDLFGATVWNVSRAGNFLYGTYTNFASDNQTIEFQGSAVFLR